MRLIAVLALAASIAGQRMPPVLPLAPRGVAYVETYAPAGSMAGTNSARAATGQVEGHAACPRAARRATRRGAIWRELISRFEAACGAEALYHGRHRRTLCADERPLTA